MEATIAARQKLDYQQSESESVLKVSLGILITLTTHKYLS